MARVARIVLAAGVVVALSAGNAWSQPVHPSAGSGSASSGSGGGTAGSGSSGSSGSGRSGSAANDPAPPTTSTTTSSPSARNATSDDRSTRTPSVGVSADTGAAAPSGARGSAGSTMARGPQSSVAAGDPALVPSTAAPEPEASIPGVTERAVSVMGDQNEAPLFRLRVASADTLAPAVRQDAVPSLPLALGFTSGFLGLLFGLGFRLSKELYKL